MGGFVSLADYTTVKKGETKMGIGVAILGTKWANATPFIS